MSLKYCISYIQALQMEYVLWGGHLRSTIAAQSPALVWVPLCTSQRYLPYNFPLAENARGSIFKGVQFWALTHLAYF